MDREMWKIEIVAGGQMTPQELWKILSPGLEIYTSLNP